MAVDFDNLIRLSYGLLPSRIDDKIHFSYIVRKNRVLAVGQNSTKTHVQAKRFNYPIWNQTIHSELAAFNNRPRDLDFNKCYLVNIRLSRTSIKENRPILRMAKPCRFCDSWVRSCGFRGVFYSTDNGFNRL